MKKNLLLLLMIVVTLFTAVSFFLSVYALRAQELAMGFMMRSYVLDLAENFANAPVPGSGHPFAGRGQPQRMMRFRMLLTTPALQSRDAGGVLLLSREGNILAASPGAERLLPLWERRPPLGEPQEVRDSKGDSYYVVVNTLQDDGYVLAAVSKTYLLAPLIRIWRFWLFSAAGASAAIFVGIVLLWRYLAAPLRRIVEELKGMKWGKDRIVRLYAGPVSELEALSAVIGRLSVEAIEKEALKVRYVTDLVQAQENTRKQLARELHDGALQSAVAAIKRIQLAKEAAGGSVNATLREHLDNAEDVVRIAADEIRGYCDELSPSWVKLGLVSAMCEISDRLSGAYGGVAIDIDVDETLDSLPEEHMLALIRIFQEAVSNSVRHGDAHTVRAVIGREDGMIRCSIEDDGSGFDSDAYSETEYERLRTTGHRGLANINERVRLLRGTMRLESRPGKGCRIDITFPDIPVAM